MDRQARSQGLGPKAVIVLARHAEREDYVEVADGRNWVARARAPWNPYITEEGKVQSRSMGTAAKAYLEQLGLPPVTHVFTSPLIRTTQTACLAATALQVKKVHPEPSLMEYMCESWFRSWCVPEANGKWGGPEGYSFGVPVPRSELDPRSLVPFSECLPKVGSLRTIARRLGRTFITAPSEHAPYLPPEALDTTWDNLETKEAMSKRVGDFVDSVGEQYRGETVLLVTHGAVVDAVYEHTTHLKRNKNDHNPYCALYVLAPKKDGSGYDAPVAQSTSFKSEAEKAAPKVLGGHSYNLRPKNLKLGKTNRV